MRSSSGSIQRYGFNPPFKAISNSAWSNGLEMKPTNSRGRRAFTRPRIGVCADNEARNVETFPDHDGGVDTVVMAPQTNIHEHEIRTQLIGQR